MLNRGRRLRAEDVREVLRRGKTLRASYISAKFVIEHTPLRAAAVVKKALVKGSVGRNRLRRALYSALRDAKGLPEGRVVIFIDRIPQGALATEFRNDLVRLFTR